MASSARAGIPNRFSVMARHESGLRRVHARTGSTKVAALSGYRYACGAIPCGFKNQEKERFLAFARKEVCVCVSVCEKRRGAEPAKFEDISKEESARPLVCEFR